MCLAWPPVAAKKRFLSQTRRLVFTQAFCDYKEHVRRQVPRSILFWCTLNLEAPQHDQRGSNTVDVGVLESPRNTRGTSHTARPICCVRNRNDWFPPAGGCASLKTSSQSQFVAAGDKGCGLAEARSTRAHLQTERGPPLNPDLDLDPQKDQERHSQLSACPGRSN